MRPLPGIKVADASSHRCAGCTAPRRYRPVKETMRQVESLTEPWLCNCSGQLPAFRVIAESITGGFSRGKSRLSSSTQHYSTPEIGFNQFSGWASQELTAGQRERARKLLVE